MAGKALGEAQQANAYREKRSPHTLPVFPDTRNISKLTCVLRAAGELEGCPMVRAVIRKSSELR